MRVIFDDLPNLIRQKANLLDRKPVIVGISGAPASGKATISLNLERTLSEIGTNVCAFPMDGFHFSNEKLEGLGLKHFIGRIDTF